MGQIRGRPARPIGLEMPLFLGFRSRWGIRGTWFLWKPTCCFALDLAWSPPTNVLGMDSSVQIFFTYFLEHEQQFTSYFGKVSSVVKLHDILGMAHPVPLQKPIPRESMATLFVVSLSGCFVQVPIFWDHSIYIWHVMTIILVASTCLKKCLKRHNGHNQRHNRSPKAYAPWAAPAIRDVRDSVGLTRIQRWIDPTVVTPESSIYRWIVTPKKEIEIFGYLRLWKPRFKDSKVMLYPNMKHSGKSQMLFAKFHSYTPPKEISHCQFLMPKGMPKNTWSGHVCCSRPQCFLLILVG